MCGRRRLRGGPLYQGALTTPPMQQPQWGRLLQSARTPVSLLDPKEGAERGAGRRGRRKERGGAGGRKGEGQEGGAGGKRGEGQEGGAG